MTIFLKMRNEAIEKMAEETGSVYSVAIGYEWIEDGRPRGYADVFYYNNLDDVNNTVRTVLSWHHVVRTIVEFKDIEDYDFDEGDTVDALAVEVEGRGGLRSVYVDVIKIR